MPVKNIIPGQKTNPQKLQRARELRHEMTPSEQKLWQVLRGNQLDGFHFRRQQIIAGYIVDFYCHSADLVIELDGEIHARQKEYDVQSDEALSDLGLKILHFKNEQVEQALPAVLQEIHRACKIATCREG